MMTTHHKIIFIGGLHRSGTTLLCRCLQGHPQVSSFKETGVPADEGQHLQSIYPPDKVHGGPGRFGFEPAAYLNESSPLASSTHAEKILKEWGRYWNLEKPFLLEKSPPNLIRSRFLQALFPGAYFIMILRHPIAVTFATQKWSRTSVRSLLEHWLICHEKFDADKEYLQNLLIIRYENFVSAPQDILNKIYTFLNLENAPLNQEVRPDINSTYFSIWQEIQKGKPSLSYLNYHYLVERFECSFNRFGYSLMSLES